MEETSSTVHLEYVGLAFLHVRRRWRQMRVRPTPGFVTRPDAIFA